MNTSHLQESDSLGFNDNGKPEPVTWPDAHAESPAERLLSQIQTAPDRQTVLRILEDEIFNVRQDAGIMLASECLREILGRLGNTAAACALRRVMLDDATPLRQAAKNAGVSHVALFLQEKTIRRRLGLTSHL